MKYVIVNKVKLNPANYPSFTIFERRDREFYETYPTPESFSIMRPDEDTPAYPSAMQTLAIWLARGTTLIFPNKIQLKANRIYPEYRYHLVDQLPNFHIQRGMTTNQKANELNQTLIAKVNKANLIPFSILEENYKLIARTLIQNYMYLPSPNQKTYLEVRAEMNLEKELADIYNISQEAKYARSQFTDEEIAYYGRIFGIELPEYYLRYSFSYTPHGYAQLPYLTVNPYASMTVETKDRKLYAGNLDETGSQRIVPRTLQLDGLPHNIQMDDLNRTKIAEAIMFYLDIPEQERVAFIADGYDYCFECHSFFEETDGCACGCHKPRVERDEARMHRAYQLYASTH